MRNLAIIGRDHPAAATAGQFELEGVTIRAGIIETAPPTFDPSAQATNVLVRILGFSFNYRDRALALRMAASDRTAGFYVGGSDFVAEVMRVGDAVTDLAPGDRVIANCPWEAGIPGRHRGIPSNHASREIQVHRREALMLVPPGMDLAVAAGFSIGGQTAFSMLRRLQIPQGGRLLLTAPRSNTSLFCLAAMATRPDVAVCGLSSSDRDAERLRALRLGAMVVADPHGDAPLHRNPGFADVLQAGGFDAVVDPFWDLWLGHVTPLMAFDGRYITCGVENQSSEYTGVERPRRTGSPAPAMADAMLKNLAIMGNCLGTTADLADAVARHEEGKFDIVVDSTHHSDAAAFLARTYAASDRFGKVVFLYR